MKLGTIKKIKAPLAMMLFALLAQVAYGQTAGVPTLSTILANTQPDDKSVGIFYHLLGDFFISPLSSIASTPTLIGALFLIFNSAVFVIGMVWAGYGLLGGIAETAHTGEALGKRLSAVWLPIRMVTGIAGIIPVFGGFSLSQVFIVSMTAVGIGLANGMYVGAVTSVGKFAGLSAPVVAAKAAAGPDFEQMAYDIFLMEYCAVSKKANESALTDVTVGVGSLHKLFPVQKSSSSEVSFGWSTGMTSYLCGSSSLTKSGSGRGSSSMFGFRVGSVNYDAYSTRIVNAYFGAFPGFKSEVAVLAKRWYDQRKTNLKTVNSAALEIPITELAAIADKWQGVVSAAIVSVEAGVKGEVGGIQADAQARMLKDGWIGLGSWYSTFAEANAALVDAMDTVKYEFVTPRKKELAKIESIADDINGLLTARDASLKAREEASENGNRGRNMFSQALCHKWIAPSACTATGNVSLGQAMIKQAIDVAAVGTGGGGGSYWGTTGLINPIAMFKNLGDTMMVIGQTIFAAKTVASMATDEDGKPGDGVISKTIGKGIDKITNLAPGGGFAKKLIAGLGTMAMMMAPFILVLGMIMAIYIPMIPFITWMGGVVQYTVVVCQGLVGAPIAALSHLEAEGEGLGRRTEAGYMFVLNVTFRPALMLFGFFLASALMIVIGTLQAQLFLSAVSNAQGNSLTGILSFFGFIALFGVINITMIQGLMNMIFLLPDQVLGLIGTGGAMTDIGKETEGKINHMFMAYGRNIQMAGGAVNRMGMKGVDAAAATPPLSSATPAMPKR